MIDPEHFSNLILEIALFALGIFVFLFVIPKYRKNFEENWWKITPSFRISRLVKFSALLFLLIMGLYALLMGMVEIIGGLGLFGVNR